ncbi:MAG: Stf0 family sulfotransferase [Natronosporangium sp.]
MPGSCGAHWTSLSASSAPRTREAAGADLALLIRAFGRTWFIQLRREDRVGAGGLVGAGRADRPLATRWHPGARAAAPLRRRADPPAGPDETHTVAWRDWFASVDVHPHQVRYGELVADPVGVTAGVLDHLGLQLPAGRGDHARAPPPGHRPQPGVDRPLSRRWCARRLSQPAWPGLANFAKPARLGT